MAQFEENAEVKAAAARVFHAAANYERGQMIPYDVMERAAGFPRSERDLWAPMADRFKRQMLRERCIALRCEPNQGYELLTEHDQVTWLPAHRKRKIARQLEKLHAEVSAVRPDCVDADDRDKRDLLIRTALPAARRVKEEAAYLLYRRPERSWSPHGDGGQT